MKPAQFELYRPGTLGEVLSLLAEHGEGAKLIAGGQSLVPLMNLRMAAPANFIDLNRVETLAGIACDDGWVRIGAMTRQQNLLTDPTVARHAPLLARAAAHIGHVQTRSRGTVGGSIAHADPSAELPLVMVTLGAEFALLSTRGKRSIAARDFFKGALTTALEPDELLIEIRVPAAPSDARTAFREYALRHGDFAIAAAAVQFSPADRDLRAGLGGVGPVPHYCATLNRATASNHLEQREAERLVRAELEGIEVLSDPLASADYRRELAAAALAECLDEVLPV